MRFLPEDFQPIDSLALAWRFTEEKYDVLPAEAIRNIRPFKTAVATTLRSEALNRRNIALSRSETRFSAVSQSDRIKDQLRQLPVTPDAQVVVSWWNGTALLTLWSIFVEYWDNFCYPSSDDVAIWDLKDEWLLEYDHEEWFSFHGARPDL